MSVTSPPTITALPTPPTTADPSTFATRADAFLAALPTLQSETNAATANVYANATDAAASATAAASSSSLAIAAGGAALWVSGTTYSLGVAVISPANLRAYRRKIAGAGTTDPSSDNTNWQPLDTDLQIVSVTTSTATVTAGTHVVVTYAGACALTLAASADHDRYRITVANGRTDVSFDIGARTLRGRNGTLTGVVTMDQQGSIEMKYIDATTQLVQI